MGANLPARRPPSGFVYSELGDYDKALAAYQQALRVKLETANGYANLATGYLQLNRLDEARGAARDAHAHNMDSPEIHLNLYWIHFLQHDAVGMEQDAAVLMGKPGDEDQMLNYESDTALYVGELAKARLLARRSIESAQKADEAEAAAVYQAEAAVREALVGNAVLANQQARVALASSNGRDVQALAALALGLAGDLAYATRLADDLAKRFPESTIVQFHFLPTIHAAVLLRGGDAGKASQVLAAAVPYELGGVVETFHFVLYPAYLRGEAYLAEKQGSSAVAEFQKILDHPGVVRSEPIGALARLGLGRAFALSGDQTKAKTAYEEFLTLWKNADPDIPVFKQAQSEYSKLH